MTVYNHMYFPIRFDTFENEFETLLNAVTLWDVSVERCLEISGPDGFTFAQLLTPRDLSKCAVGQAKYVLICDSDGGIINDPVLTRMDENTFWFALASSDALLFARGLKNAYPDLDVTIKEADVAPLQVQGPKSKDLMVKLLGESILDLKYYFWTHAEIAGVPVVVTRTGWTSEVGYEVYTTETRQGNDVYEALMKAGEEFSIKPTGPERHPSYRGRHLQLGRRHDVRQQPDRDGPRPAGRLGHADRGHAASRWRRSRIRDAGVGPKIVGVEMDGEPFQALNNVKWPVSADGAEIGKVTSAIHSPRLEKNIGFAWVPTQYANHGTSLGVDSEWGDRNAVVVEMPFVDPKKQIPLA